MTWRLKKLTDAGDTIVEVMIVLAVLGLALSISYATASRGLQQSRNAQEHSEALGAIDSQVELLRSAFAKQASGSLPSGPFCLAPPTGAQLVNPTPLGSGAGGFQESEASDHFNTTAYPVPCEQNTFYNVSIVSRGGGLFDFRVRWDGLGTLGRQQEELTYKIGAIAATSGSYTDPESPATPAIPSLLISLTANGVSNTVDVTVGGKIGVAWSVTPVTATCTASGTIPLPGLPSSPPGLPAPNVYSAPAYTTTAADSGKTYTFTLNCSDPTVGTNRQTLTMHVVPYVPNLTPLYRSWSADVADHFYSTSSTEGIAPNGAYTLEGVAGRIDTNPGFGEVALYRLYSNAAKDHFYTVNGGDIGFAESVGYTMEGVIGYVPPFTGLCPAGSSPMYLTYSSSNTDHFYTASFAEYAGSWPTYDYPEGVAFCVYN